MRQTSLTVRVTYDGGERYEQHTARDISHALILASRVVARDDVVSVRVFATNPQGEPSGFDLATIYPK